MAPKREYQAAGKSRKASQRRHNATVNANSAKQDTSSTMGNSSNSSPYTAISHDTAHADNSSNTNLHQYNHSTSTSTYIYFDRPQQTQSSFNAHMAAHKNNNNGSLPVQRWLMQSMVDDPWQGMDGRYIGESQGYSANIGGTDTDLVLDDILKENEMEISSMAYLAPEEEETVS